MGVFTKKTGDVRADRDAKAAKLTEFKARERERSREKRRLDGERAAQQDRIEEAELLALVEEKTPADVERERARAAALRETWAAVKAERDQLRRAIERLQPEVEALDVKVIRLDAADTKRRFEGCLTPVIEAADMLARAFEALEVVKLDAERDFPSEYSAGEVGARGRLRSRAGVSVGGGLPNVGAHHHTVRAWLDQSRAARDALREEIKRVEEEASR